MSYIIPRPYFLNATGGFSLPCIIVVQVGDMEFYGTDWNGPVPLDNDADIVVVDDLPPLLSSTQQQALKDQLPPSGALTEEWMITSFTIAKSFVHQCCS